MFTESRLFLTVLLMISSIAATSLINPETTSAQAYGSSFEGGRGLFYMQSARTIGKGHFLLGLQSLAMQRKYPVTYQSEYLKNNTTLLGLPITFGLTDEVDISASFYGYNDARPIINQENVYNLYGPSDYGQGTARAGFKIRLPRDVNKNIQIAGKLGALFGTSKDQIDGLDYRWTRTGTDIEASLLETADMFSWASLYIEQGYLLSGSKFYDDQLIGAIGLEIKPTKKLSLSIEANNRTFDTVSPQSAFKNGGGAYLFYPPYIGNPQYLKDNKLDYMEDFFVVVPSIAYTFNDHVSINIGAVINVADQKDPKETAQLVMGINFSGAMGFLIDSDGDGVKNNRDMEQNTPKCYPVDKRGISLDTDNDGVPDGIDREPDTIIGAVVDKWGKALDSDGDGVPDGFDREPNTPKCCSVDAFGIAIDSDEDDVPDCLDKQPDTPRGAKVDRDGVALDSDGDGVPDYKDLETDTPKGASVDSNGRALKQEIKKPEIRQEEKSFLQDGVIRLNKVHFESGKSKLTSDSYDALKTVAIILAKYPTLKIQIEGHTDNAGKREANIRLSLARAQAVLDYLLITNPGLSESRFTVQGYGPDRPVASNDDAIGKQLNRRVEFVVLNKEELQKINPK